MALSFLLKIILFLLLPTTGHTLFFNFTTFQPNTLHITFQGDAFQSSGVLQLTKNQALGSLAYSIGRASYSKPVRLWDAATGRLTDFTTHFSFIMQALDVEAGSGDGISFFLAPFNSDVPNNSSGGFLALFSPETAFNASENQIVAVEFDSFADPWDPKADHVGINVNSIVSVKNVTWPQSSMKNGSIANAWVSYNSSTKNLSVFLTYAHDPIFQGQYNLSHIVDLREILPQEVRIGFSAATGKHIEIHNVLSWSFSSSLEVGGGKRRLALGIGLALGFGVLGCGLGLACWRKKSGKEEQKHGYYDPSIDGEFEKGTGPKRFTYKELSRATNDFAEEGKLGEGGFGGVYKGLLSDQNSNIEIAVKRVSRGSKQGKKEYIAEVKIISRLRHRNLVQLIGWCHEQGDLILVYEFLPNGSLDTHLFGKRKVLKWAIRHKIALGLASALLYLHEECEKCVVHRDIKSSNIMLDTNFNAKLGDFGLARLVDHDELGSQTTVLAGTMGYLAPECVTIGMASKETDVYSFGVVALEISCGRRPVDPKAEPSKIRLVEWVWDLYGKGQILQAVDEGLKTEFDETQIERLMVVGLWCVHPDPTIRPSIMQVINVLNFQAPLPRLPPKMPVAMYFAPPFEMCRFSYTSPAQTGTVKHQTQSSITSYSTVSTNTVSTNTSSTGGSSKALLDSHKK
ncbi:L-type lectin-domain containing receptor kinase IX.1 [Morus notabilis]|uniref:non-specific serine/threonine protein kinase n=1 Tax=Morus notabilis TaxID=981085 RepID=W9T1L4_9ROSA|nr:L-type lectin-domain containing receptor kinase IX.1 [Morus notabilis]EXC36488.1 L-type lectin-domain containing receptor kinase IX.1 [Morus notabilis]